MDIPGALFGVYHKASRAPPVVIHFWFALTTQVLSRINARPMKGLLHTVCADVVLARLVFEIACLAGLLANRTLHCWGDWNSCAKILVVSKVYHRELSPSCKVFIEGIVECTPVSLPLILVSARLWPQYLVCSSASEVQLIHFYSQCKMVEYSQNYHNHFHCIYR